MFTTQLLPFCKFFLQNRILIIFVALSIVMPSLAQPGASADSTFGVNGVLNIKYEPGILGTYEGVTLVPVAQNKFLVTGYKIGVGPQGKVQYVVTRINANGTTDASFGVNGFFAIDLGTSSQVGPEPFAKRPAIQADGKIVFAATIYNPGTNYTEMLLVRLNSNGLPDATFGIGGLIKIDFDIYSDRANCVSISADGKIYIGGTYSWGDGTTHFGVARLLPNGLLDATFNGNGKFSYYYPYSINNEQLTSMLVQPDGKLLFGGNTWMGNKQIIIVGRLDINGTFDKTFNFIGYKPVEFANSATLSDFFQGEFGAITGAGTLYENTGTSFASFGLSSEGGLAFPSITGGLPTFKFANRDSYCNSVLLLSNRRKLLSGYTIDANGSPQFATMRLNYYSQLDSAYNYGGSKIFDLPTNDNVIHDSYGVGENGFLLAGKSNSSSQITLLKAKMNDFLPTLSITDTVVDESSSMAYLKVISSFIVPNTLSVRYRTIDSTAKAGVDYVRSEGTLEIGPQLSQWVIGVPILNDSIGEPTKHFKVEISDPVNGVLGSKTVGVIQINDADQQEGTCEFITVNGQSGSIVLTGLTAPRIQVQVANASWQTIFNQYYTNTPGTLTIPSLPAGSYYVKVSFLQQNWTGICEKEFFNVQVSGAAVPTLSLTDITVNEKDGFADVEICLQNAPVAGMVIDYSTQSGSAVSDIDFLPKSGSVTLSAANNCTTVRMTITNDNIREGAEQFAFTVTPRGTNINVVKGTATITIIDDDSTLSNCAAFSVLPGPGNISINNVTAPVALIQVSNANWNVVYSQVHYNVNGAVTIPSLTPGTYFVKVSVYNAAWQSVCEKEQFVTVGGSVCPPGVICIKNSCPASSINLNTAYSVTNLPPGTTVTWHSASTANHANRLTAQQAAAVSESGNYFGAVHIEGTDCYSATIAVQVTIESCAASLSSIAPRTFSREGGLSERVSVTPNPFLNNLVINLEAASDKRALVSLIDISGRTVKSELVLLKKGMNKLEWTSLAMIRSGSYYLRVVSNDNIQTVKLIKIDQ